MVLKGLKKLPMSHVLIVGIGGVGSWVAESLARSGVGEMTLVDMDHVAESNINRQIHALESTLGMAKIKAMKERIGQINPHCIVHTVDDFVTPENWLPLIQ
jgi:tRNA threonylcarbamoyladenosine dehydratase